jgi:biopolymer transport protein ExbB/TolQ
MELSFADIWTTMSPLSMAVFIGLIGMGFASVFVTFERMLVLNKAVARSSLFAAKARSLIDAREFDTLLEMTRARDYEAAPLAKLFRFGLQAWKANLDGKAVGPTEMARRELNRRLEVIAAEGRRGMGILASTGSTAPFIGLFGTVIGIIVAFQGIASSGGGGIAAVSAGIAEALVVTALGLVVAIAAVLVFNYLTARFDKFDMTMQHAASELCDYLEGASGDAD